MACQRQRIWQTAPAVPANRRCNAVICSALFLQQSIPQSRQQPCVVSPCRRGAWKRTGRFDSVITARISKHLAYTPAATSKAAPVGRISSTARPKLAASLFRMVAAVASPLESWRAIFSASLRASPCSVKLRTGARAGVVGQFVNRPLLFSVCCCSLASVEFHRDVANTDRLELLALYCDQFRAWVVLMPLNVGNVSANVKCKVFQGV